MLDKAMLKDILVEMRANPEKFLRHYLVLINGGGSANAQTRMTFRMQDAKDGKGPVAGFQTGIRGQLGQLFSGWLVALPVFGRPHTRLPPSAHGHFSGNSREHIRHRLLALGTPQHDGPLLSAILAGIAALWGLSPAALAGSVERTA